MECKLFLFFSSNRKQKNAAANHWEKTDHADEERGEGEPIGANKPGTFSTSADGTDRKWRVYGGGTKALRQL